jgi:hypothetical protein
MKGKLHSNIFNMNRYLLSHTNLLVTFTPSKASFSLFGTSTSDKFCVYLHKAWLRVRRVYLNPSIALHHAKLLETKNASYPYKHVIVKTATIPQGSTEVDLNNIYKKSVPNRLVIGLVESSAFAGQNKKNPYNFQHFNLQEILLKVGGNNIPYSNPIKMDFNKGNYAQAYNTLFQGISEYPNDISYTEYANGYTFFAFNLTPDLCNLGHFNETKVAEVTCSLSFKNPVPVPVHAIFYLELDNVLQISKARVPIINPV